MESDMEEKMVKDKKNTLTKPESRLFELEVKLWGKMVILAMGPVEHCFAALCDRFKKGAIRCSIKDKTDTLSPHPSLVERKLGEVA